MLKTVGYPSLDKFVEAVVPRDILTNRPLQVEPVNGYTENELTTRLKEIASQNKIFKTYIGQGYSGTIVPPVIQRNILECPEWYTSYTPYQPEISQGRLESLLNFQTMVADLTGMSVSNASLLDEGTAAAEAVIMSFHAAKGKKKTYYVDPSVNSQTINVVQSRATPLGINVVIGKPPATDATNAKKDYKDVIGCLVQYPATDGSLTNWSELSANIHASGGLLSVASDLLALTLIEPPSKFGADIVLGSSQRFGVPMGYGGPHAAFFAVADGQKRKMPGRLIGKSKDRLGNDAYRLALQTREQHIKREKATSNICTAQALLANMAAMYAVYHGPQGLKDIASRVFTLTSILAASIKNTPGLELVNQNWFDTLTIKVASSQAIIDKALAKQVNLYQIDPTTISISLDETVSEADLVQLIEILGSQELSASLNSLGLTQQFAHVDTAFQRSSEFLRHDVFNKYHTETELLRYVHHLQSKDLSLANSMIPLGSCTMKLNATTQMAPISWPEFSNLHPFVPLEQAQGYKVLLQELEADLAEITGFDNVSLQPNSGAQGEYAGLRVIKAYLESTGQGHRDICLIPVSAHGTNPASAVMAGMKVISIKCTANGELDLPDMIVKAEQYKDRLAAVMITYPSTFGVFEPGVKKAIDIVHSHGGQVYMDGANMNAQIGLTSPGEIGADVCHLNLHKTFCIPHGGGGPGMGPICVKSHLGPFLPSHPTVDMSEVKGELIDPAKAIQSISAAPWGSASILPISWAYIKLMGGAGLAKATKVALLNANYMMDKLRPHYPILYTNDENRCAHEFILDVRGFKETSGVEAIDIAKRLQDYGFHGPTMSWPVANTLMIEPTESESLAELDRFCDALIAIRAEISEIEAGSMPRQNNALKNSPHSTKDLLSAEWDRPYSREKAAFPLPYLLERKFWPSVTRLDDTYGDMNLFCTCEPPALD
ncbi:glycine dehydrogenase [Nadsonia fulvescens var. elongata DSM 6958]|uniref:Glycine cleavage system P protein n=1 Tax=Nadsonia fulvescens var. elongata DSM 6958 TaxID=857566 RepID=A0A1E3PGI4_9ASCO|nr:glycine dehydrogenase [Nadsonia fulvescens var. elongata DSM 6958]